MKTTALTLVLLSVTCAFAQDSPPEAPPPAETAAPVVVPATIEELEGAARDATNGAAVVEQALLELSQRAGLGRYYFVRIKELFDQDQPEADVEARHLFRFLARVQNDEVDGGGRISHTEYAPPKEGGGSRLCRARSDRSGDARTNGTTRCAHR